MPDEPSSVVVSRRRVVGTTAWAAPLAVVATAAPAYAGSGGLTIASITPTSLVDDVAADREVSALVSRDGTGVAGESVVFTVDGAGWLAIAAPAAAPTAARSLATAEGDGVVTVVSDATGAVTVRLRAVAGAAPAAGAQATLTATHAAGSVSWTVTHQPWLSLADGSLSYLGAAVSSAGVRVWGHTSAGSLGNGTRGRTLLRPGPLATGVLPSGVTLRKISMGTSGGNALGSDGRLYRWGHDSRGVLLDLGLWSAPQGALPLDASRVVAFSSAWYCGYALLDDGRLLSWGRGITGGLGDGTTGQVHAPAPVAQGEVPADVGFVDVAGGAYFACALGDDGRAYAWGSDSARVIDGSEVTRLEPAVVWPGSVLDSVTLVQVSAGQFHVVALADDGQVYGWGRNYDGQLGRSDSVGTQPAVFDRGTIPEGVRVLEVSVGQGHTLARADDGFLYATGNNSSGQLGDGTTTSRGSWVRVAAGEIPPGETIVQIATHWRGSYALTARGVLYAWGEGGDVGWGGLGDGLTTDRLTPGRVVPA